MTDVVIDASATIEILLATPDGASLVGKLPRPAAEWAPEIYFAEVAGGLRRAELTGRIDIVMAGQYMSQLLLSPVRRVQVKPLLSEAWLLRQNVTITDGLYVALARHLRAPLMTADRRLSRVPRLGIQLMVP